MEPLTEHTDDHLAYWAEYNPRPAIFTAPDDPPDCVPCPGLITEDPDLPGVHVVRVAWKPNELEVAALAQGGTIWLSTWHGLPAHMLEVQPPAGGMR